MNPVPVIAVDGPSGSGKGRLCQRLSETLDFHLLDSGALYRLTALAALRKGVSLDDAPALARVAGELDVTFQMTGGDPPVRAVLEGQAVDRELRTERCGAAASRVAELESVRGALLARQQAFRRSPGLVADGRDMGTVVFPDAALKLFLTASAEERARRRHNQLIGKGISASLPRLLGEIAERDRRDSERSVAPLRPATDAIVMDTTDMTPDEVFLRVMSLVYDALGMEGGGSPGNDDDRID